MSIRSYADTAIEQGKLATEQANQLVINLAGRAAGAVGELRAQAERALPIDTIKSVVEPRVERAREQFQKQARTVAGDPRVARAVATAETVGGAVTSILQDRVVKPVVSLTGLGGKPASTPTASAPRKPAATRPATKPAGQKAAQKAAQKPGPKTTQKAPGKRTATKPSS